MGKVVGVAHDCCVERSWALPTPTFGSFKNVPDGKAVEDHDLTAMAYVLVDLEIFKISKKIWIDLLTFGERSAIIGATNAFEQEQVSFVSHHTESCRSVKDNGRYGAEYIL